MKSIKDRVGSVVESTSAAAAIKQIVAAEEAGIRQIWMNQAYLDTLTVFAPSAFGMNEGFLYRFDRNSQWWSCVIHAGVNMLSSVREKLQFFTDNFLGTIHNLCPFSKVIKGQRK